MRLVIDSNIFVSSLDPRDAFHAGCSRIFEKLLDQELEALCPVLILAEVTCVLRRRTNSEALAVEVYKNLAVLPSITWLDMTLEVLERACLLGARTGLRGGDACVLQVAEQYGVPILTQDKEIKAKAPRTLMVFQPTDLPV